MNHIDTQHYTIGAAMRLFVMALILCLSVKSAWAQKWSDKYNAQQPLLIVGDWDKPPYEFLNDRGEPAGTNIDLMRRLCEELGIPCQFMLKEWSSALKTFNRGDADIILANGRRYTAEPYVCTENVINYNRICAATCSKDSIQAVSTKTLVQKGVVLKQGDYTTFFFRDLDAQQQEKVEYQTPKVALQGLLAGDFYYFCWGEEPLKWKIKELHLDGIRLCDVDIPPSEIHIVGRDKDLIYKLDDLYSRLKQSGEVQRINDRWMHPERVTEPQAAPNIVRNVLIVLLLAAFFLVLYHISRLHVKKTTQSTRDLNNMMQKALHMGNYHVLEYDIKHNLMTNLYGTPILPAEGITLEEFTEHISPQEREEFSRKMEGLTSGRNRKFELKKRWKTFGDGQWLNLEGHAIVETDENGHPAYVINALNDITQNVEQDHAERDLERKYRKLTNIPFLAMSFYDSEGWIIDINDAMRSLCGITSDNPDSARFWLSVSMFDIPMFRSAYAPGAKDELLACMHMDYPDMGLDNYVQYQVVPLFDETGRVANYFCSTLNVTDEQQCTSTIRRLTHDIIDTRKRIDRFDKWLNFLTKQGKTYLWYSDVHKQTAYFYRSLKGEDKNDFITMPFSVHTAHMLSEDRDAALICFNSRQPFESIQHFSSTVIDQAEAWFIISGTPIVDEEGRFTGHKGLSIDISTEMNTRKRLKAETEVAKNIVRLKSGFMASMTHELRTPLNAIIGFSGVLSAIDSPDERAEYIRIIRENCDMLRRLIDDILTESSLNEGPTSIQPDDVDFAKSFDDICLTLQQRISGQEIQFIKEAPYDNFYTNIDIARINQIITNFFSNAVKFTKKGYIKLGYQYKNHGLRIYCEDTGAGIPAEKQQVVFERFVKLNEFVQGTGMGLSIAKNIAERMGGNIGLKSDGQGKGCTFWVNIPCIRRLSA